MLNLVRNSPNVMFSARAMPMTSCVFRDHCSTSSVLYFGLLHLFFVQLREADKHIFVLCAVLTLALAALIIDLRNPNVGWVRTALRVCAQV